MQQHLNTYAKTFNSNKIATQTSEILGITNSIQNTLPINNECVLGLRIKKKIIEKQNLS